MRKFLLIYGWIMLLRCPMWAQSYSMVHYDTKDGLPSATVYDISQDKNGFMWFATENGLSRFDGKNFRTYTTKDGLPDNSILKVHGDNTGRVYFAPFTHGLYYFQNDSFVKVQIPEKYKVDLSVINVFMNKKDKIVFSGIARTYLLGNDRLTSIDEVYHNSFGPLYIKMVYDTLVIAGSEDSLFIIYDSGKIDRIKSSLAESSNITFDEKGIIHHFNVKYNLTPGKYLSPALIYVPVGDSLRFYSSATGELQHSIRINKPSGAFIDNENNLWLTTLGNGVYRIPSFTYRNLDFGGNNEIFSLVGFDHRLFAGTDFSKMFSIIFQNGKSEYDISNYSKFIDSSGNTVSHYTGRNRIYSLYHDKKNLYIGADAFLLIKPENRAPVYKGVYPVKDLDISGNKLLACTGRDALVLDAETFIVKDTLLTQRSTCGAIYHDNYYIGTFGGLIRIDPATKAITELYNSFAPLKGRIVAINRGVDDDLWIATSGSGLVHYKNDKIISVLKEEDGLTSNICTSIFIDDTIVWLGTNNGLNRIETNSDKPNIVRLTTSNGLGADFIDAVFATDSMVYVGTEAGITYFHKNVLAEKSICILQVLGISENNVTLRKDSAYTFRHDALNIRVDFTAISFKSAGDIVYYYKLQGLDNDWNITSANSINFATLQPGNYTLFLKAKNKFGVESLTKSIAISVLPPWWKTWTFVILVAFVIILLLLFIYTYNVRNIRKKEKAKREIEARFAALEQSALQSQMNPHFIFNCLNSIQTFILNFDAEGANNYLTTFASLIRQTLDNSTQPLITVSTEIKYLETYLELEKLRFRNKFRYVIHIDDGIDQNNVLLPGMLLQPFVENSLRHGIQHRKDNNGLISIVITKQLDQGVLYTIKDNGVGRKKAAELRSTRHIEYQSRGISISEKRVAAINNQYGTTIRINTEDITDEYGMVAGTSVSISIPPLHK